jgi:hypothetical protein
MKSILLALIATIVSVSATQAHACKRETCRVYVHVSIAEQLAYIYLDGKLQFGSQVSTGVDGKDTDDFDGHPYLVYPDYHMSNLFPGGDYIDPETGEKLGNMPYAMMFNGAEGIHGTPAKNFSKIGKQASHGCVRMYPDQAKKLNRWVQQVGLKQTWFFIDRHRVGTAEGQRG